MGTKIKQKIEMKVEIKEPKDWKGIVWNKWKQFSMKIYLFS